MSPRWAIRPHRWGARRGQGGYSFVEVIMSVAIMALLVVPLLGWMLLGLRTTDAAQRSSEDASTGSLVATYLARDVAAAHSLVAAAGTCTSSSPSTTLLLAVVDGVAGAESAVDYAVEATAQGDRLVRRACHPDGTASVATLASRLSAPAGGWSTAVRCTARPDLATAGCAQVELVVPGRSGGSIRASATMRVGGPR